jgi:muramoyltetrapeptide carboxypeptidase LdcA involved in peptidoglycan recycling
MSTIAQFFADLGMELNMPVCSGLSVGHGTENITLPIGLEVELDTIDLKLTMLESGVSD